MQPQQWLDNGTQEIDLRPGTMTLCRIKCIHIAVEAGLGTYKSVALIIPAGQPETEATKALVLAAGELLEVVKEYRMELYQSWHSHMSQKAFESHPRIIELDALIAKATPKQEK